MAPVVELSGPAIASVYEALLDTNEASVDRRCEELGIDSAELRRIAGIYHDRAYGFQEQHLVLLSWMTATTGPLFGIQPAIFEADVQARLLDSAPGERLVFPLWLPAIPVQSSLGGRMPARLLVQVDTELLEAYEGLLHQYEQLSTLAASDRTELGVSSVAWRIVAIAERLRERLADGFGLRAKMTDVQGELLRLTELSYAEKGYCRCLSPDLVERRNALTHFASGRTWSFPAAARASVAAPDDLWSAAAATTLAVARDLALRLSEDVPPRGPLAAVLSQVDY